MSVSFSETSSRQERACRKMVARDLFKERGKGKHKVLDEGPFRGRSLGAESNKDERAAQLVAGGLL